MIFFPLLYIYISLGSWSFSLFTVYFCNAWRDGMSIFFIFYFLFSISPLFPYTWIEWIFPLSNYTLSFCCYRIPPRRKREFLENSELLINTWCKFAWNYISG